MSGVVWGCLGFKLSGVVWGCLGLSGVVWGCLGLGAVWLHVACARPTSHSAVPLPYPTNPYPCLALATRCTDLCWHMCVVGDSRVVRGLASSWG